jgi:hypothetical protein
VAGGGENPEYQVPGFPGTVNKTTNFCHMLIEQHFGGWAIDDNILGVGPLMTLVSLLSSGIKG